MADDDGEATILVPAKLLWRTLTVFLSVVTAGGAGTILYRGAAGQDSPLRQSPGYAQLQEQLNALTAEVAGGRADMRVLQGHQDDLVRRVGWLEEVSKDNINGTHENTRLLQRLLERGVRQ